MDIFSLDADGIRKMLDECRSDIAVIAARHPEVMEAFKNQYETDKKMYAKLPTFIFVSTNAGLINTTIRYRDFLRVLPMFEQRPIWVENSPVVVRFPSIRIPTPLRLSSGCLRCPRSNPTKKDDKAQRYCCALFAVQISNFNPFGSSPF